MIRPVAIIIFLFVIPFIVEGINRNISLIENDKIHTTKTISNQPPSGDYYTEGYLRFQDFVYQNNIKTILFNRKGWDFSDPIIEFNSLETLILRFDDLDADFKNYTYTIIHCDALWQPTDLMQHEYIEGFLEDQITDYSFSRNTRVPYTHYMLEFPNQNIRPRISGNYILKVFRDGNPDNLVFTRRFMVFEQNISIETTVKQATNLHYRQLKQEVDFTINTSLFPVSHPFRDIRVVVTQNGRWDNAIFDLKPRLVQGNLLIYDHEDGNLFLGGNEFRNFDTKSLRVRSLNVDQVNAVRGGWEVLLMQDRNRRFLRYTTRSDINGRFLIRNDDFPDDFLEGDYAWVHFNLPNDNALPDGNVYVMGELTDWNFTRDNRMEYNYRTSAYELSLLLKQGFYDYKYVYLEDGSTIADESLFEGTHSVTENDYTIYVYFRGPGDLYERLIGVSHVNTGI